MQIIRATLAFIGVFSTLSFSPTTWAELRVSEAQVDFGRIHLDDFDAHQEIALINFGQKRVIGIQIRLVGPIEFAEFHSCRWELGPNQRCYIDLRFEPVSVGSYFADLYIESADQSIHVPVRAEAVGRRYP